MKWVRLRQRLREFDCGVEWTGGVGNRVNITRTVTRRGFLGRARPIELHTQVACSGDGSEADRSTVHRIRKAMHLDDAHDVDSATFYAGAVVDSFIIEYRRILRRLAKL